MKKDITAREDIVLLVDSFYHKIKKDDLIGFIFTDIARVNFEKHLPVMYDFFENMLFYTGTYSGNPMELHKQLDRLYPLTKLHFHRWTHLFTTTVDELFNGETAELAKQRALSIAQIMQIKIAEDTSSPGKIK
ncbi:MAG: group III truncated hemoglobin [Ferruginibacter sp.]